MTDLVDLSDAIDRFARACGEATVTPQAALREGGVDPSLWLKWRSGKVSPTFKSFEAATAGLQRIRDRSAAA